MNSKKIDPSHYPLQEKTIGIIQITRIGDVLQTFQAVSNFKRYNEGYKFVLIARKKFAYQLDKILRKAFDDIYYLDLKDLAKDARDVASFNKSLRGFVETVNQSSINVLLNFSFSKSSSYLCHLIKSEHKLGICVDKKANTEIKDPWSQYVYSTVMAGSLNPLNLIDIFSFIIGGERPSRTIKAKNSDSKNIVIHPFASHSKKYWSHKKWVEVIFRFLKGNDDATITLVGSPNETDMSEKIFKDPVLERFRDRVHNMTGKTNMEQLFEIVEDSRLLIAHDSMVGHIAAITRTKSITVSLGTARVQETSPYIEGSVVLSPKTSCYPCFPKDDCDYYRCHSDIPYQVISDILKILYENNELTQSDLKDNLSSFHLNSCHVYLSRFSNNGLYFLEDLNDDYLKINDILRLFYRVSFLYIFAEEEETYPYPELDQNTLNELNAYKKGIQQVYELSDFGMRYSQYILEEISKDTPNLVDIKKFSAKIDEIDQLMNLSKSTFPLLSPIVDLASTAKANLVGENIVSLSEQNYLSCFETNKLCQIMYELTEKTIAEHRIQKDAHLKME